MGVPLNDELGFNLTGAGRGTEGIGTNSLSDFMYILSISFLPVRIEGPRLGSSPRAIALMDG
jgi:hypothetical protein